MVLNKKGSGGDNLLSWNLAYLLFGVLFFSGMLYFIFGYLDGASLLEDSAAKRIAVTINSAEIGQEVYLDMTEETRVAIRNGKNINDLFDFDNQNNVIIVSLRFNGGKSYQYFREVDVVNWRVEQASGEEEANRLYFEIRRPQK